MKCAAALLLVLASATLGAAGPLPLDADKAVELALESSDRVVAAARRAAAAGERVDGADARRLPSLDLEAGVAHRSSVPETAFPASIPDIGGFVLFPDIRNTFRAGVVVNQPLWTGGAIAGSREAARREEDVASAELNRVEADLRLQARTSYWAAVAATAALEAAAAEAERAGRLLEDARALRAAGMAVRADELGAEARLAAARLRVIQGESELQQRLADLRSLLGLAQGTEVELTDGGGRLPPAPPALEALIAEARAHRPEIAVLTASRDALSMRGRVAAAPRRPQVALSGRWDVARPNERYLPLEDEWNDSWSVGVVAGWRLFDGKRTRSEVAALDAERAALEADLAELDRRIALEVENARRELATSLAADHAAAASVAAATAREADSRDRYNQGMTTVYEVTDAQTQLAEAELARVRTSSGAWSAAAGLDRAVGR